MGCQHLVKPYNGTKLLANIRANCSKMTKLKMFLKASTFLLDIFNITCKCFAKCETILHWHEKHLNSWLEKVQNKPLTSKKNYDCASLSWMLKVNLIQYTHEDIETFYYCRSLLCQVELWWLTLTLHKNKQELAIVIIYCIYKSIYVGISSRLFIVYGTLNTVGYT